VRAPGITQIGDAADALSNFENFPVILVMKSPYGLEAGPSKYTFLATFY